jgi:hypothetical protein
MRGGLMRASRGPHRSDSSIHSFYLDESGNSGDLVKAGTAFDFGQQPVFVLAGVGIADGEGAAVELERLRAGLVADLAAYLGERRCPIFIEVVDKHFFICATMVNHFVIPPVADEFERRPDVIRMKNEVSEYLHALMPLTVMRAYIDACAEPSVSSTRRAFEALRDWLRSRMPDDSNASFVPEIVSDSITDFENDLANPQRDPQSFLPVPDFSKAQRPFWILPNLSSFTNLYARINLFRGKKMDRVRIIHDEQLQYAHILQGGKRSTEEFTKRGLTWPLPHADYGLTAGAELTFAPSLSSTGIQVADVIAGFVMRFVQGVNMHRKVPSPDSARAFQLLLELAEPERGTGFNFVVSRGDFARLDMRLSNTRCSRKCWRPFRLSTDIASIVGCGEAEHPILAIDGDDHSTIGVADRCSPTAKVTRSDVVALSVFPHDGLGRWRRLRRLRRDREGDPC